MKHLLYLIPLLITGCTNFYSKQVDSSSGNRVISSEIRGTAWFSSSQAIQKMKAMQTDKVQSFGMDGVSQQGATNTVAALKEINKILENIRPMP
jgi:intracellular septation protein A